MGAMNTRSLRRFARLALFAAPLLLPPALSAATPDDDFTALKARADAWDVAIVRKERAAIEENMAAEFRQIDGAGNVVDRATFVEELMSPDLVIDPYGVDEFEIRFYGDVALVTGRTRMTGRYRGEPFTSHYRFTDTYVREDGAWKVVQVQITRIRE